MTSVPDARREAENPYHDRTEGNILTYTGAGREGDQSLAGVNKRIPQQIEFRFPIYGFQIIGSRRDPKVGRNRWRFLGLLEYIRHYSDHQLDVRRQMRQVWMFEFLIHPELTVVSPATELDLSDVALGTGIEPSSTTADDRQVVLQPPDPSVEEERIDAVEIEAERSRLLALPPNEFEFAVRDALIATGLERVHVTRYSQDGGIDVNAYVGHSIWPIRDLLVQIQAKRWLRTVGRKEVAELRGSLQPFSRGAVVTTSHFSRAAVVEADSPGKNPIILLDGYSFARIVRSFR